MLPDMKITLNGLDEPRILVNPFNISDQLSPTAKDKIDWLELPRGHHQAFFEKHCQVKSRSRPGSPNLNALHGYAIEPSHHSYTTELLPLVSQTRIDPCFADIRLPSYYYMVDTHRYGLSCFIDTLQPWRSILAPSPVQGQHPLGIQETRCVLARCNHWRIRAFPKLSHISTTSSCQPYSRQSQFRCCIHISCAVR